MTAPRPHGDVPPRKPSAERAARRLGTLARKWGYLISTTAYLPHTPEEIERELAVLAGALFEAVASDPPDLDEAAAAGGRLVELRCVGTDSLRRSLEILGKALLREPELRRVDGLAERVVLVLGAFSSGYGEALREDIQKRQEGLSRALLKVEQETRQKQIITRAQFEEVFAGSASGVALTELDGRVLRANAALAKTLNRTPAEIATLTLFDLVHPDEADQLRDAYRDLVAGKLHRLRVGRRLVGKDGEPMWATFAASVIRDAVGTPRQLITIVDDDTEVSLLQRRLSHQALHDVLTGLPNRQFFSTRLENLLRDADPARGSTLFHLDVDGFSQITGGLGQDLGDRVLRAVAAKLKAVFDGENALVARLGGDEFGVVVQNTADTPDVVTLVRRITHELAEPEYVDGQRGVAVSASIGVVHRPPRDITPAELLRASDLTLRRVQRAGNQWGLFDRELDRRDRHDFALAAAMAGAWENGEIEAGFRPLVSAADGSLRGAEARLRWRHPSEGVLTHETCVRLAAETGLALPLGTWLLRTAAERLAAAGAAVPLTVELTPQQAADPELVGEIREVLRATGWEPDRVRPGFPAAALLAPAGDAADNLKVLAEIGVPAEIHGLADVTCLTELPARAVRLAPELVARREHPLLTASLPALIDAVHLAGAEVGVTGVARRDDAEWWRDRGADRLSGPLFSDLPGDLPSC
ncbi:GGDEF domain-containing protein [Amycolatopsis australiensis]|uniref:PAS domain S-box-containing protein/diguanylate cyclase (GGDEF) domain-containing protein n=1 Tax=Amycolatopsis australiensis TaxID=546364 RepID=A0A1K1SI21_9PSEU|nr:diguanylate cyclase [Amycolatopsis australiensis]SFW84003.1 PAS domain S-box-containing protein/diguanylate cyclase (GGDEF) domain-containing protein [Amycolatopsis australiensis]